MRLLLLTQYWPPEYGPDQAILLENMQYLQRHGIDVTVVAALPSYPTGIVPPAYRNGVLIEETTGGIRTLRTWTWSGDRTRMKQRILNEVSFAASCFLALTRLRGRFDLVLTLTPPQELTPAGWLLSRLLRARYALYVMDLMPEVAVSLGMIRNRRVIGVLRALAGFCYRRAAVTAAASEEFKRGVEAYGIPPADVVCVPNGIDTNLFRPTAPDPLLREEMGLGDRFIALYAGTHGFSHDLDAILAAAEMAQGEGDESIAFVLMGDGSDKPRIRAEAEMRGLRHVYFHDPVERERLPAVIAAADAMLITFRRLSVNEGVIPIKLYDAMACAKPIVLAIEGEARAMFLRAEAGIAVEPSNPAGLLAALRAFQRDPDAARCYGDKGRRFVEANYSRDRCAEILRQALLYAVR